MPFLPLSQSLEVYISENQPVRSLVGVVEAHDMDDGADGLIDYSITSGNDDGYFAISGAGFGEVVVQQTPINPHTYTLTISAADRGDPPRSTRAVLTVHVVSSSDVDCNVDNYGT